MAARIGSASLGASTFWVRVHRPDECDNRGLPLTPNSIRLLGRFQALLALEHHSICSYLDLVKANNVERMVVVSEYHNDCLENHLQSKKFTSTASLSKVACQILQGLAYLHEKGIVHRNLALDNVLVTAEGQIKLHNYGLYYITDKGKAVNFPIGSPRYLAPEVLLSSPGEPSGEKCDIWSLGIIILELFIESNIYSTLFLKNALPTLFARTLLLAQNYTKNAVHPIETLLESHPTPDKTMDSQLRSFLEACLCPVSSSRSSAAELLQHPFIAPALAKLEKIQQQKPLYQRVGSPFRSIYRSKDLELPSLPPLPSSHQNGRVPEEDHFKDRSLKEVYFWWSLAGGDLHGEVQKKGLVKTRPAILNLPCLVSKEGVAYGMERDSVTLYDPTVIELSLDQLRKRLESMTTVDYYPIIPDSIQPEKKGSLLSKYPHLLESAKLPFAIKERDVEYQFHRVVQVSRLIEGYPYTRHQIITEAVVDICPLLRAEMWAAILNVRGDIVTAYTNIDKESETTTDRQIAVDIPRCHQYDLLLASPEGHNKFLRLLKAWVVSHPRLVYWQGLDSLCAPFLSLNFNNEALAHASLTCFIDKYLHHFFLKDNSSIMQEYLAVFSHMIAYHDPELFNHLDSIGFMPELYAIPWYLTVFTHIFPLEKIYRLWDTLLLGNCSFPLYAGLAILQQVRSDLLRFDFNECIMMFSDMPDIDIQQCVTDAVKMYQITPSSLCVRCYEHTPCQHQDIRPEVRKEPLSLQTLKMESSPQISAHDLITLCKMTSHALCYADHNPPPRRDPENPLLWRRVQEGPGVGRKDTIIVDIRTLEEYRMGHIPRSISLPFSEAFSSDGSLVPCPATTSLGQHRGKIFVVIANKSDPGPTFCRQLVRLNFPHVCLLHGGAGVLRSQGLLLSLQNDP